MSTPRRNPTSLFNPLIIRNIGRPSKQMVKTLAAENAGSAGSVPDWGTKIHVAMALPKK